MVLYPAVDISKAFSVTGHFCRKKSGYRRLAFRLQL